MATSPHRHRSAPFRVRGSSFAQFLLDAIGWAVAIALATLFRYEFAWSAPDWPALVGLMAFAAAVQLGSGWFLHLYRGRYAYGSFEEVRALTGSVLITAAISAAALFTLSPWLHVPRSAISIAGPITIVLLLSVRYVRRFVRERRSRPSEEATPILVYGAGDSGRRLVTVLATDPDAEYRVVGLLDDAPEKRHAQVRTAQVRGSLADLPQVAAETGAEVVVVAIARADAEFLRHVHDIASRADVRVKVMPPFSELLHRQRHVTDLRDLSIEDLIGRQPVDTEIESIAGYITGRRVLVTGAGGSIGSELCRQLSRFGPSELIMLDRDETGLQLAQLSTAGHGLLDTRDVVLADIRDAAALERIFSTRRPEVVFHAAALKHLPMLEQYPDEAWKTNVLGTLNVLQAARAAKVGTLVNISTDKAANPTSVLGHSKRVAEKLTAWAAQESGLRYLSVRFGNVIGSRGSMLPTFQALIESGGPLTVTHPEVTRYFMTIPEACQLVIQAGGIGRQGEVLILDMGEPVRILDVARRMIEMSGKRIEIVFTGLREGEKLHEELVGVSEDLERPFHPKISHTRPGSISPGQLSKAGWERRMRLQHGATSGGAASLTPCETVERSA